MADRDRVFAKPRNGRLEAWRGRRTRGDDSECTQSLFALVGPCDFGLGDGWLRQRNRGTRENSSPRQRSRRDGPDCGALRGPARFPRIADRTADRFPRRCRGGCACRPMRARGRSMVSIPMCARPALAWNSDGKSGRPHVDSDHSAGASAPRRRNRPERARSRGARRVERQIRPIQSRSPGTQARRLFGRGVLRERSKHRPAGSEEVPDNLGFHFRSSRGWGARSGTTSALWQDRMQPAAQRDAPSDKGGVDAGIGYGLELSHDRDSLSIRKIRRRGARQAPSVRSPGWHDRTRRRLQQWNARFPKPPPLAGGTHQLRQRGAKRHRGNRRALILIAGRELSRPSAGISDPVPLRSAYRGELAANQRSLLL